MKGKKTIISAMLTFIAVSFLAACGSQSASSSKQVYRRMEKDVIQTMDYAHMTDAISGQAAMDVGEGLYRYGKKDLEPGIATKVVQPTANGTVYTYKLRKSEWSNGKPLTAKDFVYAWQRAVDPKTKSEYAYLYSGIKNADAIMAGKAKADTLGVKAVDDYTFQVTLEKPIPYFNAMIVNAVFYPLYQPSVDKAGSKYGTNSDQLVFNGPFKLQKWTGTNDSWSEVKNTKYWNQKNVHLDQIDVQVIKDPNTAANLYAAKKLDDAILTGQVAKQHVNDKDYVGTEQGRMTYLDLNANKQAAFKNTKIRQAFSMALNRPEFVKQVLGDGSLASNVLTPLKQGYNPKTGEDFAKEAQNSTDAKAVKFDLSAAKKLWAEGLQETGQTSLSVTLTTDDTDVAKQSAEYIQSALQELPNLKVNLQPVPFKTRIARSLDGSAEFLLSGWQGDFPDPISFLDLWTTGNTYNFSHWSNATYDQLIADSKGKDANDTQARYDDLLKAQDLLTKESASIPLYQTVQGHLINPKVKGLIYTPTNNYNFVGASISK